MKDSSPISLLTFLSRQGLLILIMAVSAFLYSYNLESTLSFVGDTARDTLRALEIWQNKELTLIGPPLSLGFNSAKEVYFSSLSLYLGLVGLLLGHFEPASAASLNVIITLISIPFFSSFVRLFTSNKKLQYFATALYAWSPLVVAHTRFFWNPNLIIPLSVFFWYFVSRFEKSSTSLWSLLTAGFLVGLMFDLHYLGILGGALYATYLFISRRHRPLLIYLLGFALGSLPIFLFEIRNHFYLTKTLWDNIMGGAAIWSLVDKPSFFVGVSNSILALLGFIHTELSYPVPLFFPNSVLVLISLVLILIVLLGVRELWRHRQDRYLVIFVITSITLLILADAPQHTRYIWSILPLVILIIAKGSSAPVLRIIFLGFVLWASLTNITTYRVSDQGMINVANLEQFSQIIVRDRPTGKYNITDAYTGDARATSLRYFLLRDASHPPQDDESYQDLDLLYIITKDQDTQEFLSRWETTATPNLEKSTSYEVGEFTLYKYIAAP